LLSPICFIYLLYTVFYNLTTINLLFFYIYFLGQLK
jgi:hypothetical protein